MMRNPNAKHLDFSDLQGVIPDNPKWLPSNIDMLMERKGKFLLCEWKRENEEFGGGQKRLLKALAAHPDFTVLVVQGNTDNGMEVQQFWEVCFDLLRFRGGSTAELKLFIKNWYEEVEDKDKSF
jgi:hypothetical protein